MSKATIYVGCDHGNKMMKGSSLIQYNSGFVSTGKQEPIVKSNLLLYNDEYFSIGQGRFPVIGDKTIDDKFFILTLPIIAHAAETEGVGSTELDIFLGTGLPISNYSRLKNDFIRYFTRDNIEFIYNNKEYKKINIKSTFCYPQGYSGFVSQAYSQYKGVSVSNIWDIGGFSVDCCIVENGILNINSSFSLEMGVIKLIGEIQKAILNQTGMSISEAQVEMILQGKDATLFNEDNNILEIVNSKAEEYTNTLLDMLMENNFQLRLNPNIVIGGGGLLIKRFIENNSRVQYVEFLDSFANAKSYKMLMEQSLKRR